jgi:hypothetical protein
MSQRMARASIIGAGVGVVISVLVLVYGYFGQYIQSPAINDWYILIACPPSIMLMAVDNGRWPLFVLADSLVVVTAASWYVFLFAAASMVFYSIRNIGSY